MTVLHSLDALREWQQNDQGNEEELSWTDGTHGVKIWDEVLKSNPVVDTCWA
ncbi:hypothetical protein N9V29_03640 [Flavobacteriales bacterium]|nr:hypothetical protein [Flavobacteriales bacterium]